MGTQYAVRWGDDYSSSGAAVGNIVGVPYGGGVVGDYPKAIGPLTLGYSALPSGINTQPSAAWVGGDDPRLRGFAQVFDSTAPSLRVDLPEGAGDYFVWVFSTPRAFGKGRWRLNDGVGGTNRYDFSWDGATSWVGGSDPASYDQFIDHAGTVRSPIDADALLSPDVTPLTLTFSSGVMEFLQGGNTSGAAWQTVSAIVFQKVDAEDPPVYTPPPVLNNPNVTYEIGVPLLPITLQAEDQYGDPWTGGGLPDATVESLSLPVDVTPTTPVAANQATGVWTFNLTPTEDEDPPAVGAPTIASFLPATGVPGGQVVVTGTNYDATTVFRLSSTPLTVLSYTGTTATLLLPGSLSTGRLSATNSSGTGNALTDLLVVPPSYPAATLGPAAGGRGRVFIPQNRPLPKRRMR